MPRFAKLLARGSYAVGPELAGHFCLYPVADKDLGLSRRHLESSRSRSIIALLGRFCFCFVHNACPRSLDAC